MTDFGSIMDSFFGGSPHVEKRKAAATAELRGLTRDGVKYVRAGDVVDALVTEGLTESVTLRRLRKYLGRPA